MESRKKFNALRLQLLLSAGIGNLKMLAEDAEGCYLLLGTAGLRGNKKINNIGYLIDDPDFKVTQNLLIHPERHKTKEGTIFSECDLTFSSRPEEKICQAISVQTVVQQAKHIRGIIYAIEAAALTMSRGEVWHDISKTLARLFGENFSDVQASFAFIIVNNDDPSLDIKDCLLACIQSNVELFLSEQKSGADFEEKDQRAFTFQQTLLANPDKLLAIDVNDKQKSRAALMQILAGLKPIPASRFKFPEFLQQSLADIEPGYEQCIEIAALWRKTFAFTKFGIWQTQIMSFVGAVCEQTPIKSLELIPWLYNEGVELFAKKQQEVHEADMQMGIAAFKQGLEYVLKSVALQHPDMTEAQIKTRVQESQRRPCVTQSQIIGNKLLGFAALLEAINNKFAKDNSQLQQEVTRLFNATVLATETRHYPFYQLQAEISTTANIAQSEKTFTRAQIGEFVIAKYHEALISTPQLASHIQAQLQLMDEFMAHMRKLAAPQASTSPSTMYGRPASPSRNFITPGSAVQPVAPPTNRLIS